MNSGFERCLGIEYGPGYGMLCEFDPIIYAKTKRDLVISFKGFTKKHQNSIVTITVRRRGDKKNFLLIMHCNRYNLDKKPGLRWSETRTS